MRVHNLNYFIVGLFVCAMIAAGVFSAVLLAGGGGPTSRYVINLDNVNGVKFGTLVQFEGYPVGQVENVSPVFERDRTRFRLDLSIAEDWPIPVDSIATVKASNLLAAKTIEITSGFAAFHIEPGSEIPSRPPSQLFDSMAAAATELASLTRDVLRPMLKDVAKQAESYGGDVKRLLTTTNDVATELEERLPGLLDSASATTEALASAAQDIRAFTDPAHAKKLRNALGNLEKMIAENREGVSGAVKDLQYILQSVARRIDAVSHNMDITARNMNEFSRLIRRNPGVLLSGAEREEVSPAGTDD